MPQIDQIGSIYASQLLWLLLVFAIIYVVIGRGMLPKIEATVDARNGRIASDLAAAEKARDEARAVQDRYEEEMNRAHVDAHAAVQEAKTASTHDNEIKLRTAMGEVSVKVAHAEAALAAARARALGEIEMVAVDAVRDIVRRLADIEVGEDEARIAVSEKLSPEVRA